MSSKGNANGCEQSSANWRRSARNRKARSADDPLLAFEDAIAHFSPTHLLIGLRNEDRAGWQERGLLEVLHEQVRVPITVFDTPTS